MIRKKIDDWNLLPELKKGNPAANEHLFKKYHRSMCARANDLIHDLQAADIIYFEVLCRDLLPKIHSFNSLDEVYNHLCVAISDACDKYLRSKEEERAGLADYIHTTDQVVHPEEQMQARLEAEARQAVDDYLNNLTGIRKYVGMLLFFCETKDDEEAADIIGIKISELNKIREEIIEELKQLFAGRSVYQQHYWLFMRSNFRRNNLPDTD